MPKVVHPNVIEIDFLSDPLPVREKAGQATTRLVDDGARDALDLLNVVERRQRRFGHPDGVSASLDRRCEGTIVCVPYAGDATEADLSSFFGGTKPFAPDIRVWTKKFEAGSWVSIYVTGSAMAWFVFLMDEDRSLVQRIRERFPCELCLRFQGNSLMDLVGHENGGDKLVHGSGGISQPRAE